MTDKLFDSFIKQKLEQYKSDVPDDMWDRIVAKEEKKPKGFFWFNNKASLLIVLAGFLTIAGAVAYNYTGNKQENIVAKQNVESKNNNSNISTDKSIFEKNNATNISEQPASNNNINNALNNNIISNEVEEKNNTSNHISTNNNNSNENNLTLNTTTKTTKKEEIIASKKSKKAAFENIESIAFKNNSKNKSIEIENEFAVTKANKYKGFSSLENNNATSSSTPKKQKTNNKLGLNVESSATENSYSKANYNTVTKDLILLKQSNNFSKEMNINLGNLFGRGDDCPNARGCSRNDFYLEPYISGDYTFKQVVNAKNGLNAYLTKKDSVEVLQGGFTIGARISKSIDDNLLLKAGIQFSQVNEEFRLRTENERRQTTVINSHIIVRPGKGDTTISDTSVKVEVGYRLQTHRNYYRNIEVPIMLSYEFGNPRSNWKFAANGGAIINVSSWREGVTLDTTYRLVSINSKGSSSNDYYKQSVGVSLYGSFSVIRRITDYVDVFAEPYYRFSLNNMNSKEGFAQRFNALGLQLGARIRLSKFMSPN